jgi:hypothetical protein
MTAPYRIARPLIRYIAYCINEEIKRGNEIPDDTIADAIDAFAGGAR